MERIHLFEFSHHQFHQRNGFYSWVQQWLVWIKKLNTWAEKTGQKYYWGNSGRMKFTQTPNLDETLAQNQTLLHCRQSQPGSPHPAPQNTLLTGAQVLFLPPFPSVPFQQRLPLTSTYPLILSCCFRNIYSISKNSEPPTVPSSPIQPLDVTGTVSEEYGSVWLFLPCDCSILMSFTALFQRFYSLK